MLNVRSFSRLLLGGVLASVVSATCAHAAVTITNVRLLDYRIGRTKAFVTSKGRSETCYGIYILLDAHDDAGHTFTALGDALPRGTVTNETLADAWTGAQLMAAELTNKSLAGTDAQADLQTIRSWMTTLNTLANAQKLTIKTPPRPGKQLRATLCGFDEALLDLVGQVHDKPIYDLLGGEKRQDVSVSAQTFNADASTGELNDKVEETADAFGGIRLKVGLDDKDDIEKLRLVANDLKNNPDTNIWVDANHAWKSADKSIEMLARIRDALKTTSFKATFICEQPTDEDDMEALAKVTTEVHKWLPTLPFKIVLMADEAVWDVDDAKKMVALHAADYVNIKIQKAGGLLASKDLGDYLAANAPDVGIYVGGVVATDITSWANLQLCYALPRLDFSTGCIPRRAYPVNVATIPVGYVKDKIMKHPTTSGLGTALSLKKLEGYIQHDYSSSQHAITQPASPTTRG